MIECINTIQITPPVIGIDINEVTRKNLYYWNHVCKIKDENIQLEVKMLM